MAILYPTNLDEFSDPGAEDKQGLSDPTHSVHHKNHNDAIEALQAKVGADDSIVVTSHDYKISGKLGKDQDTQQLIENKPLKYAPGAEVVSDPREIPDKTYVDSVTINSQTDAYTLALGDAGKLVIVTHVDAKTLTVPKNSEVAFPIGTKIAVMQGEVGVVTITPVDGDVTLESFDNALDLTGKNAACVLIKKDTDNWLVEGNLI